MRRKSQAMGSLGTCALARGWALYHGIRGSEGMLLFLLALLTFLPSNIHAQDVLWSQQFGSSASDYAYGAAVDGAGNVYVVGTTYGALPGQTSAGYSDAFVRKYDANGNELWTRQFGSSDYDIAWDVAVDGAGNIYVTGDTGGSLPGQTSSGDSDAFVRKYDANGNELWTRQFGSPLWTFGREPAVDSAGNIYVAGVTYGALPGQTSLDAWDAFLRKYDANGNELWTRQFGTSADDVAVGAAVDAAGNVNVTGGTGGTLTGQTSSGAWDAFLRKYDANGNELWTRQFGSSAHDTAVGVAADVAGSIYVTGFTDGALPAQTSAGAWDAFLRKYDANGNELWTRQFGSSASDEAGGVAADVAGSIYVAGHTWGTLPGQTSSGGADVYVREYDANGNELWTRQFGSSQPDGACIQHIMGVAADGAGNVYVATCTADTLPGQTSSGGEDAFVVKLGPPFIIVPIDIKPSSFPNSMNLGSGGTVPVAIFSTTTFDAMTVGPTTVTLASAPVKLKGQGTPMASLEDVNGDGLLDLVVHVSTEALQLSETDTEAVLEGETFDGTRIRGVDTVRVVP